MPNRKLLSLADGFDFLHRCSRRTLLSIDVEIRGSALMETNIFYINDGDLIFMITVYKTKHYSKMHLLCIETTY
jgi:hypothetical protein